MVELLLAFVVGDVNPDTPEHTRTPIAFVGEQLEIREVPCGYDPETGETRDTRDIICMDSRFVATYRVLEVHEGDLVVGSTVTFQAADHYGFPAFARYRTALLFLGEHESRLYHIKYRWANAYPLEGGGFGSCGCEEDGECHNLEFSPLVTEDLSHASDYVVNEYRDDPSFEIVGDRAVCVRGERTADIYRSERPELLRRLSDWR